jgi:hypothetical protein
MAQLRELMTATATAGALGRVVKMAARGYSPGQEIRTAKSCCSGLRERMG